MNFIALIEHEILQDTKFMAYKNPNVTDFRNMQENMLPQLGIVKKIDPSAEKNVSMT